MEKEHKVNLIVSYNNYTERKVMFYELIVMDYVEKSGEFFVFEGKNIELPKSTTIFRMKIPMKKAKEMIAAGVKVAGYTLSGE